MYLTSSHINKFWNIGQIWFFEMLGNFEIKFWNETDILKLISRQWIDELGHSSYWEIGWQAFGGLPSTDRSCQTLWWWRGWWAPSWWRPVYLIVFWPMVVVTIENTEILSWIYSILTSEDIHSCSVNNRTDGPTDNALVRGQRHLGPLTVNLQLLHFSLDPTICTVLQKSLRIATTVTQSLQ